MIKYILSLCLLLTLCQAAHAQIGLNSPSGVRPAMDVEMYSRNSFLVSQKYRPTSANPLSSTQLIGCGTSVPTLTAQAGIMMDVSGFNYYPTNVGYDCFQRIRPTVGVGETLVGIEIIIEQIDMGDPGPSSSDYLGISSTNSPFYGLGGTQNPGRIVVPDNEVGIQFRTSNDGIGGRGFRIQWRALLAEAPPEVVPSLLPNVNQLLFNTRTGALFVGNNPESRGNGFGANSVSIGLRNLTRGRASAAIGLDNSTDNSSEGAIALGNNNSALGLYAVAIGSDNTATGYNSLAMGYQNRPSGTYGVAIGNSNGAGQNAVALGFTNGVGGDYAVGIGRNNGVGATNGVALGSNNTVPSSATSAMALGTSLVVSGNYSTAMGTKMNTNGQAGSFMIGDADPLNQGTTPVGAPNQFVGRFLEGYYLMTSGNNNPGGSFGNFRTGVQIGRGQNSWAAISDSTKKERLRPVDHADLLRKINSIRLSTWNYKGQTTIRHWGPMAQDFYAAFGHDGLGQIGCDTLIYSHDFAGVTFAGVQALIRENETLKAELAQTKAEFSQRLALLEGALLGRKRVASRKK